MPKKFELNDEEKSIFREMMKNVKPLKITKILPTPRKPVKKTQVQTQESPQLLPFSNYETLPPVASEELLVFKQPFIPNKMLRKLQQGQYNVDAILDLHGMTVAESKTALMHFLQQCIHKNARFVLIIHGKGRHSEQPILKNKVNYWLRQTEQVLAFRTANGRGGAVCVLLKKREKDA